CGPPAAVSVDAKELRRRRISLKVNEPAAGEALGHVRERPPTLCRRARREAGDHRQVSSAGREHHELRGIAKRARKLREQGERSTERYARRRPPHGGECCSAWTGVRSRT